MNKLILLSLILLSLPAYGAKNAIQSYSDDDFARICVIVDEQNIRLDQLEKRIERLESQATLPTSWNGYSWTYSSAFPSNVPSSGRPSD